ncbi:hypothetical protein F751_4537 [Auxenochlorella protothecoides]|uniref:Uncharacterized protein n=1 Tax=Auxenochlorella protothecoides TaxID=3075 RepID=A0A087SNG3_AUXPR|nr:hypothetical protein F751_4537 [Auxenochlorella protothecoides]KFM27267.1 hypothetical protein F751_4537 [Auxenochlorella protothecoides]
MMTGREHESERVQTFGCPSCRRGLNNREMPSRHSPKQLLLNTGAEVSVPPFLERHRPRPTHPRFCSCSDILGMCKR